ncbi:MAG: acyl-CoA/acyl-ACP dehydrogenase [Bacteroidetes bacterium]|nr:acyl-CoA/acyl-ACP dehydrogenase [Bacteroidota bacterium]
MNFELGENEKAIKKNASDLALLLIKAQRSRPDRKYQISDHRIFSKYDLAGAVIPKTSGGPGFSAMETALSLEGLAFAKCDPGFIFSLGAHLLACVMPLVKNISAELQKKLFPQIISGELLLANGMTEERSGSDPFNMKTTAKKTENGYLLHGQKHFITNSPIAGGFIIYALTDEEKGFFGGVSCFYIPAHSENLHVDRLDLDGAYANTNMGTVFLEDVFVPQENLIGKKGAGAMIFHQSMNWERACFALMHCGTMDMICTHAVENAKRKETKQGKLSELQAVQFHIADMHVHAEVARMLAYKALSEIDKGKDATVAAARAKILSSEALDVVARTAIRLDGAAGLHDSNENIYRALAGAQAATIYSGANDVLRELIAGRL